MIDLDDFVGTQDEALDALIGSTSPHANLMGRLVATGIAQDLEQWINTEVNSGQEVTDVLDIVQQLMTSTMASLIVQCWPHSAHPKVSEAFSERYVMHFKHAVDRIYTNIQQEKGGQ